MPNMTKNSKTVWLALIGLIVVLTFFFLLRDYHLRTKLVQCGDPEGPRPAIDLRSFEANYTGYSVSLEAEIAGKGKLAGKIEPAALQKLSESIQTGQEFRKALVAGYNACAVSRSAYQVAVLRFQSLDGLARRIDSLAAKPVLSATEQKEVAKLIDDYSNTTQRFGEGGK